MFDKVIYQDMQGKEYTAAVGEDGVTSITFDEDKSLLRIFSDGLYEVIKTPFIYGKQKTMTEAEKNKFYNDNY